MSWGGKFSKWDGKCMGAMSSEVYIDLVVMWDGLFNSQGKTNEFFNAMRNTSAPHAT
jgi:hypothetical protein